MAKQFEVGKTYSGRFMSDWDSIASFTITARTAKSIKTVVRGEVVTRRVSEYCGVEQFKPFGSYSMCMVIDANDADLRAAEGGMSKPTPGPWAVAASGIHIYGAHDRAVCLVQEQIAKAVEDANARLIAASPDLLEALTFFANELRALPAVTSGRLHVSDLLAKADAAIAKATGDK